MIWLFEFISRKKVRNRECESAEGGIHLWSTQDQVGAQWGGMWSRSDLKVTPEQQPSWTLQNPSGVHAEDVRWSLEGY